MPNRPAHEVRGPSMDESVLNMNGSAAITTVQCNLWRQRLDQESWATTRAHPFTTIKDAKGLGRDARIRNEIELALRADRRLRVAPTPPTLRGFQTPCFRPRLPVAPPASQRRLTAPFRSTHVATPIAAAGSFTTHELRGLAQFKNEVSGTWG